MWGDATTRLGSVERWSAADPDQRPTLTSNVVTTGRLSYPTFALTNTTSIASETAEVGREESLLGLRTKPLPSFRHRTRLSTDSQSHLKLHLD
jgi:hypothetical protein